MFLTLPPASVEAEALLGDRIGTRWPVRVNSLEFRILSDLASDQIILKIDDQAFVNGQHIRIVPGAERIDLQLPSRNAIRRYERVFDLMYADDFIENEEK